MKLLSAFGTRTLLLFELIVNFEINSSNFTIIAHALQV